jgi:hypothetical protein
MMTIQAQARRLLERQVTARTPVTRTAARSIS